MHQRQVSRTVQLASGGSVTVSIDSNLFMFDHGDRTLVFAIVDHLNAYEDANRERQQSDLDLQRLVDDGGPAEEGR